MKKDAKLAAQLRFELIDSESQEEKREKLRASIVKGMELQVKSYFSPGYLLMDVRSFSGEITQHATITKDKFGEISLNCTLLLTLLKLYNQRIAAENLNKAHTLCIYIIGRIFKILLLIQKQHPDLHSEFRDDIIEIGKYVGVNDNLMRTAIQNGLDINWLLRFQIPDNLATIHKDLRDSGLIR